MRIATRAIITPPTTTTTIDHRLQCTSTIALRLLFLRSMIADSIFEALPTMHHTMTCTASEAETIVVTMTSLVLVTEMSTIRRTSLLTALIFDHKTHHKDLVFRSHDQMKEKDARNEEAEILVYVMEKATEVAL